LCIFVLDLDPSNAIFDLRVTDFGWSRRLVVELGDLSILGDLVGLRLQVFGHSIS
jgi:hypothetical protein